MFFNHTLPIQTITVMSRLFLILVHHERGSADIIYLTLSLIITGYIALLGLCTTKGKKFITIVTFEHHGFIRRSDGRCTKQRPLLTVAERSFIIAYALAN